MADGVYQRGQVMDANGNPEDGARVFFYTAGTTNAESAYTDDLLTTAAANPVVADSNGFWGAYLDPNIAYDIVVKSPDDAITYESFTITVSVSATDLETVSNRITDIALVADAIEAGDLDNLTGGTASYDTLADMTAVTQTNDELVLVAGAATAGDGGGGTWRYTTSDISAEVTSDTQGGLYRAVDSDATGASGGYVWEGDGFDINPVNFGVVPDTGVTMGAKINAMISACFDRFGFAEIKLPEGTFTIDETTAVAGIYWTDDNIALVGSGIGGTILQYGTGDMHLVSLDGVSGGRLENMTINGGRTITSAGVHSIRIDGVTNFTFRDLIINDSDQYGIGIAGGTQANLHFENIEIFNSGGDGIDIKNPNDDSTIIFFENIRIKGFGLDLTVQAGIDLRGPCQLNNIRVEDVENGHVGVRFREGALLATNGYGAHDSVMTNFHITAHSSATTAYGIQNSADDVRVGNGTVTGAGFQYGYVGSVGDRFQGNDFSVIDANTGIFPGSGGETFSNITTPGCSIGARVDADDVTIRSSYLEGSVNSLFVVDSSSNNTLLAYCELSGTVVNNGTNTEFEYCLPTSLNTGDYSATAGQTKFRTIRSSHGTDTSNFVVSSLDFTPDYLIVYAAREESALNATSNGVATGTGTFGRTCFWQYVGASARGSGRVENAVVHVTDGTDATTMDLSTFASDGFTLTVSDNSLGEVQLLILAGEGDAAIAAGP